MQIIGGNQAGAFASSFVSSIFLFLLVGTQHDTNNGIIQVEAHLDYRVIAERISTRGIFNLDKQVLTPDGSTFGGITSLTYDEDRNWYYALTDDIEPYHLFDDFPATGTWGRERRQLDLIFDVDARANTHSAETTAKSDESCDGSGQGNVVHVGKNVSHDTTSNSESRPRELQYNRASSGNNVYDVLTRPESSNGKEGEGRNRESSGTMSNADVKPDRANTISGGDGRPDDIQNLYEKPPIPAPRPTKPKPTQLPSGRPSISLIPTLSSAPTLSEIPSEVPSDMPSKWVEQTPKPTSQPTPEPTPEPTRQENDDEDDDEDEDDDDDNENDDREEENTRKEDSNADSAGNLQTVIIESKPLPQRRDGTTPRPTRRPTRRPTGRPTGRPTPRPTQVPTRSLQGSTAEEFRLQGIQGSWGDQASKPEPEPVPASEQVREPADKPQAAPLPPEKTVLFADAPSSSQKPSDSPSMGPSESPSYTNYYPRFYTLDLSSGSARILDVTYLADATGRPYRTGEFVPRAITYSNGRLFIAHEGGTIYGPGLWEYDVDGRRRATFTLPTFFTFGNRMGFKTLSTSRGGDFLWAATKFALPVDDEDYVRLVKYKISTRTIIEQFVYETDRGLLDIIPLDDNGSFLSMETGGRLYYVLCSTALDVSEVSRINRTPRTVKKHYLRSVHGNNLESMAINFRGSGHHRNDDSSDHRKERTRERRNLGDSSSSDDYEEVFFLFIVGDNNFDSNTDFIAARLRVDTSIGVVRPEEETRTQGSDGYANDPAIWIDPDDPEDSLIIGTLEDEGIGVYSLSGKRLKKIDDNEYYAVDVIYAFKFDDGTLRDIAVATRGDDEKIDVFTIDNDSPYLRKINSGTIRTGGDCYDVAGYISPFTGKAYAFIARREKVIQMELFDAGEIVDGEYEYKINGSYNRVIDVDRRISGLAVDREMGYLYVATKYREKIYRYDAEPNELDGDDSYKVLDDDDDLEGTIRGMTMYYNGYKDGYLIVSLSEYSAFAVYERNPHEDNDYIGKFTIGRYKDDIDRTDGTRGIDVVNVNLGPDFECGAFVAQDANNDADAIRRDRTNFKLVEFDDISDVMSDHLEIDTETWGPRRYNLAVWTDLLSQNVGTALYEGKLSGRDAEDLLEYLKEAAAYMYPPASQLRQMMEPYYFVRGLDSSEDDGHRERDRRKNRNLFALPAQRNEKYRRERRRILRKRCKDRSNSSSRGNYNRKSRQDIGRFVSHLRDLKTQNRLNDLPRDEYNLWLNLGKEIRDAIPDDQLYSSSDYDDDDNDDDA